MMSSSSPPSPCVPVPGAGAWSQPVCDWLAGLRLEQYGDVFRERGLVAVGDCVGLSSEQLEEMGVSLPGHRKRILGNLPQPEATPIPKSRTKFRLAADDAPPIPPRASHSRPPQCFSPATGFSATVPTAIITMATVPTAAEPRATVPTATTAMATVLTSTGSTATVDTASAPGKPTPVPRPRLQISANKEAQTGHGPAPVSPSFTPALSPTLSAPLPLSLQQSLSPSISQTSPTSPSLPLFLHSSSSPSLSPSISQSSPSPPLPRSLSPSEMHLHEQCSLGQLPPLPPKCYPPLAVVPPQLTPALLAPPAVPRRPPAPPQRPPRTTPHNRYATLALAGVCV
ncbi:hypothetical protein ACEWY4_008419 [Coilia grayii]|uniref:SAM domain-containing protein n=1 Tax=Coilia grayii TaxID=363190 RepID=A0ABD1KB79_9TELE